jgi:biotin operon repressor
METPLLDWRPQVMGATYDEGRDHARLKDQALRVFNACSDGRWYTLADISRETGDPEASVSARLRQIRSAGYTVERRYVSKGLHEYRVLIPQGQGE